MPLKINILSNILIALLLILQFSCNEERKDNNSNLKKEIPKALQDNQLRIKSYDRYGSNLLEELYNELIDKSAELKRLEEELEKISPKYDKLNQDFTDYKNKSDMYYRSAKNSATAITDSLLKKKMLKIITTSRNKYTNNTAEINSLLYQIVSKNASINDHHTVLKLLLTLPIIEKYQDENLPGKNAFQNLIKEQGIFIKQIDSLTPEY